MEVKPGTRLRSVVCNTEVIVVRAPAGDVLLCCGGRPLELIGRNESGSSRSEVQPIDAALSGGTLLGKRYVAAEAGLELLCTRSGEGTLTVGDSPLEVRNSKPLPSSD